MNPAATIAPTAEIDAADLRAKCQRCRKTVAVRRHGKAWRMRAHKRAGSHSWSSAVPCDVRGVDALPGVLEWIVDQHDDAARIRKDAASRRIALAKEVEAIARMESAADATTARMNRLALALEAPQ